jgi:hypothetical protein
MTRATVHFDDRQGNDRWATRPLAGRLQVGDRVTVRYDPDRITTKDGVVIGPRTCRGTRAGSAPRPCRLGSPRADGTGA